MSLTVGRNTASSPIPHHLPLSLLPPLFPSRLPFPSMPTFLDHLLNATPHSPLALLYIHRFLLLFLLFLLFLLLLLLLLTYLPFTSRTALPPLTPHAFLLHFLLSPFLLFLSSLLLTYCLRPEQEHSTRVHFTWRCHNQETVSGAMNYGPPPFAVVLPATDGGGANDSTSRGQLPASICLSSCSYLSVSL